MTPDCHERTIDCSYMKLSRPTLQCLNLLSLTAAGMNRLDFHLTYRAEKCFTPRKRNGMTPDCVSVRKTIRCVMNPVSCN